jgi:hypothetical protein
VNGKRVGVGIDRMKMGGRNSSTYLNIVVGERVKMEVKKSKQVL